MIKYSLTFNTTKQKTFTTEFLCKLSTDKRDERIKKDTSPTDEPRERGGGGAKENNNRNLTLDLNKI